MAINWNDTFVDGDYLYSREVSRMFHSALLEREAASSKTSWEWYIGADPTDDNYAYPGMIGRSVGITSFVDWGGIGYLWGSAYEIIGYGTGRGFGLGRFADPQTPDIAPTDDVFGADWDGVAKMTRAKFEARTGRKIKRAVAIAIPDIETGQDQFGQTVAVGTRGNYQDGHAQRVYEWDGSAWNLCTPQWSARPTILDTTVPGDLDPVPTDGYDEDGNPITVYEYRDQLTEDDYMGVHLWTDARDLFNMMTKFVYYPVGGIDKPDTLVFPAWTVPGYESPTILGYRANGNGFNAYPDPPSYAAQLAMAQGRWDDTAGPPHASAVTIFNTIAYAYSVVTKAWEGASNDVPVLDVEFSGGKDEVGIYQHSQVRKARIKVWSYAIAPTFAVNGYGDDLTYVFDANGATQADGSTLAENRWNLVADMDGPEDRTPGNAATYVHTGRFYGLGEDGEYPVATEPVEPVTPNRSTSCRGYAMITPVPDYLYTPAAIIDYGVPGGFDYQP